MKLNEREQAIENKFAHDEELHFKVRAKRNKLAGLWAAEVMGKSKEDANNFAEFLVTSLLNREQLAKTLKDSFDSAGIDMGAEQLEAKIEEFVVASRKQFME